MGRVMTSPAAALARFRRDRSGMAAVEFAIIAFVMVWLYFGAVEFSDAFTVNRKLTIATSATADLVSQSEGMNTTEMTNIFDAASAIVAPYAAAPLKVVVSHVNIDVNGTAKVDWSKTKNGTERAVGSTVALPPQIAIANSGVVMAEASYDYTSILGMFINKPIVLTETFYLRPRSGNAVPWVGP